MTTAQIESSPSVSVQVVEAIADHEGVAPRHLKPQLCVLIDTDALNTLIGQADAEVVFKYKDYEVTVTGPHDVRIKPLR